MSDNIELARQWLEIMPEGAFDKLEGRISPQFVLRLPFAPPGVPQEFAGRDVARQALSGSAKSRSPLVFEDLVLLATEDPELFVATASGEATMASGKIYRNNYVIFVRIRDGMVVEHIEYMNPLNIIAAYEG
jgi:ketosteroid isomerase-like protein